MDFSFTEEHRLLEQSVREWGAREIAPRIKDLDREHRFDPDILPQMAKLGLLGISVPARYGGAGMDYISLGLASEELEYVDTSLRVIMSVHAGLNCLSLLTWGTEEQKRKYLVPQAQGSKIATFGLTEPAAGSDVRGIQSVAVKRGDRYVLTGEKMWISLADVADHFLVVAWSDLEKKKQRDPSGLTAFLVERGFKGFSSGTIKEKWGILAGNTGYFKMDEMEVPEENVLGRPGEGFKIAMFALDQGRYTVAAGATGLIRACRDASAKYAKERRAFGVEIAQHQLVKAMIAEMESDYQVSRLLWLKAGWLKNAGERTTREASLAKWYATVASERAAGNAVQVHGANGYSDDYPVGRFYRNCKGAVIYEGTREVHALMQADYVLGYRVDRPTRCELPPFAPGDAGVMIETTDLSLEFLRVVEQAAIASAHTMGQGDRPKSDHVAVEVHAPGARRGAHRRHDRDRRGRARRGPDALHRREAGAGPGADPGRAPDQRPLPGDRHRGRSPRGDQPLRRRRAERHDGAGGRAAGRPAPRARSLHGEDRRRAEVEERRRPGRPGRGQPGGDRDAASTAASRTSWSSCSNGSGTRTSSVRSARPGPGSSSSATATCRPASPRPSSGPGCTR